MTESRDGGPVMGRRRWWPWLRLVVLSQLLVLGLMVFRDYATAMAFTPGSCMPIISPADRLRHWHESGRRGPLGAYFGGDDRAAIAGHLARVVPLGLLAAWSAWALREPRSVARFRLGTAMVLVALLPLEWGAGRAVLAAREHWVHCQRLAEQCGLIEEAAREMAAQYPAPTAGASGDREVDVDHLAEAEEWAREKELYRRAAWRPWAE